MKYFLYRIVVVLACAIAVFYLVSSLLSRDQRGKTRFELHASVENAPSLGWVFTVNESGLSRFNNHQQPATVVNKALNELVESGAESTLTATGPDGKTVWSAEIADKNVTIDGKTADLAELIKKLRSDSGLDDFTPTHAVTVKDVLDARLPMPTRSRASFPKLSFEQAFPGDSYRKMFPKPVGDDELFVIDNFSQAPILDYDKVSSGEIELPERWRLYLPDLKTLPPVEQRLPENPAVVVGPDSPGRYSPLRSWHRSADGKTDWSRKIGAESFIRFDPSGRIQPCLAYRWDVSDDNRVYTFYLRKGHRWSDGAPFTSHDIAFVCNEVIGSSYWGTSPNWMMETDGFSQIYSQDIVNWQAFKKAMLDPASPMAALVERVGSDALKESLNEIPDEGRPNRFKADALISRLNTMLRNPAFLDLDVLGTADLESDLARLRDEIGYSRLNSAEQLRMYFLMERNALVAKAKKAIDLLGDDAEKDISKLDESVRKDLAMPDDKQIARLNLMLFRANMRGIIVPAERKRVKVEPVPDENGDDSHIIRFTFERPNSIFLEKTGTFMFYRGLFEMPRHTYLPYMPEGTDKISDYDVFDWNGLVSTIVAQADSAAPSPGGQLWAAFDESTRQMLRGGVTTDQQKQALLDAINAALARRNFYTSEAFGNVDFDRRWNELTEYGYPKIDTRTTRTQAKEIVLLRDLLKRFANEPDGMSDAEIMKMNAMCFREAYNAIGGAGDFVAINRETSLDLQAQAHPNKFTTWVTRLQKLGLDRVDYATHVPTLRAWYPISDNIDPEFEVLRNPYYYRVDQEGRQLPYIDCIISKAENEESNVLLAMSSGNVDMQARVITFDHFSYLKSREKFGNYRVLLWANDYVGEVNFYTSAVHKDPFLQELFRDKRFRHALSLAMDRQEIIDIVFKGLGTPAQFSFPEGSPYYNEKLAKAYVEFDPDRANAILDEIGLDKRGPDGMRLRPDGEPLNINLDTTDAVPVPAMMLACEQWRKVGLSIALKLRSAALINRMIDIGILDMGTTKEGGNFIGPMQVGPLAPVHPAECPHWSDWVKYMTTRGRSGTAPPEWLFMVNRMWLDVIEAENDEEKMEAWRRLTDWAADDLPRIGITTSPGKLIYVKNDFKNVPDLAMAGWIAHEPANSCPEGFYFAAPDGTAAAVPEADK